MNAWLVVNHFVHSEKFDTLYSMLIRSCEEAGVDIKIRTNAELLTEIDEEFAKKPDFVLFWDKDLNLCRHLENQGIRVFNRSCAIEVCDNKNLTCLALEKHGIPMPRTILAPKTFRPDQYPELDFLVTVGSRLGFPLVVKEAFGSFGAQVHLARNLEELQHIVQGIGTRPMQFQEFIRSEWNGQTADVRLHVVGGEVKAAVLRTAKSGDFRANVTNGGKMLPWEASPEQRKLAVRVCQILGTDFAGVDLLFGKNGNPILCEVNTNAHFKNLFDAVQINVGQFIAEYAVSTIRKERA
ncbi:MAG: RimK family alpha-L-glutamate ligase [Planctomycetaceae bacterium]|nr:RimK family alpha-L-glutamate ligase [Planctomycetaceae bacterium]MBQ2822820.1 RimK family alpha-L-glutamate ligase [Thermoguttaceae bacterium]